MKKEKMKLVCHKLIEDFSEKTDSFPIDVETVKNGTQWSLTYKIIKIQFVLTKKEKLMCPASTLFCRIYLGKNDEVYFHIPELIEYLDEDDFKCYYFSYIESEERLEKCFRVLENFLLMHFERITGIGRNFKMVEELQKKKVEEIERIGDVKPDEEDPEPLSEKVEAFEEYVLMPRLAGDYGYREFMRGNYKKAIAIYQKSVSKNHHLIYEKRLLEFIKSLDEPYETIPEECASVLEIEKYNGTKAEGMTMLKGMLLGEFLFGSLCCIIVFIVNLIVGHGAVVYIAAEWYWGFLIAGLPAVFGAIAFRKLWEKLLQRKEDQKALAYDELVNGPVVNKVSRTAFMVSVLFSVFIFLQFIMCNTSFYEERMRFGSQDDLISLKQETYVYEELEEVIYSKGVYNEYGEFIDRPSYLLVFENGTVWDSDGYTSTEVVEQKVLPLLKPYYDEVRIVEAR